jgi:bifunctional non-homologous end joining protein LigD
MAGTSMVTEIEGRQLTLTNLEKVLYPDGTTKGQVVDYYVRIAPVLLPHLAGRNITMKRFPDGSTKQGFFAKNLPSHAPDWIERVELHDNTYIVCRDLPTLVWMANLAALELHVPLHRAADDSWDPDRLVFDLDPGPGTGIAECCEVAVDVAEFLVPLGMKLHAKTSGSKGMQLYATPPTPLPYAEADGATELAKRLAEGLAAAHPDRIVAKQAKELRPGKVLIDWSQNVRAKTTVCAYSMRARAEPTVSTPLSWDEVVAGAAGEPLRFVTTDVLERVAVRGDLFAGWRLGNR